MCQNKRLRQDFKFKENLIILTTFKRCICISEATVEAMVEGLSFVLQGCGLNPDKIRPIGSCKKTDPYCLLA